MKLKQPGIWLYLPRSNGHTPLQPVIIIMRFLFPLILLFLLTILSDSATVFGQKISPEDVVAKHLNSIGGKDRRESVSNRLLMFDTEFKMKGSAVVLHGRSLVLSAGDRNLWGMNFNSNDYPIDRFGFDGKEVRVKRATATARSLLGDFLYNHREILREGLLGGVLTTNWPLLQLDKRKAKLTYEGAKEVNGRQAIVLGYDPKNTTQLRLKIYFDAETFRHVRTEYTLLQAAGQGPTVDTSAGQGSSVYRLVEDFSNFKTMGQLIMPSVYKLTYSQTGTSATRVSGNSNREAEWTFTVTDIGVNREIDDTSFDIDR